jgi:CBS domain-containing protein
MKVKDFMIKDVITVKENDSLRHLLTELVDHKIGGVPVVDDNGKMVGMVSDGDVLRSLSPQREQTVLDFYMMVFIYQGQESDVSIKQMMDEPVRKIMTKKKIYSVMLDDHFEKVLKVLSHHHFKKVPVVDEDKKVVGVISRGDVIRYISRQIVGNE